VEVKESIVLGGKRRVENLIILKAGAFAAGAQKRRQTE